MTKETDNMIEGSLFDTAEIEAQPETSMPPKKGRGRKRSTLTEDRPPLDAARMRSILESIQEIESATGIRYIKLHVTKKMIIGIRESSGKEFTINLDDLYTAYNKCLRFTSPEVKRYIFMGHSPAVALLRLLKSKA